VIQCQAQSDREASGYWVEFPDLPGCFTRGDSREEMLELAKKLTMSVQQLQKLECPGKSNPTVRTLAAVSEALDEQLRIELVA
jgi:hypothetical protein